MYVCIYICTYIYIYTYTYLEGTKGSQGMGVARNNRFDRALRSMLSMLKPSGRPMFKPPSLGPPWFPLKSERRSGGAAGGQAVDPTDGRGTPDPQPLKYSKLVFLTYFS